MNISPIYNAVIAFTLWGCLPLYLKQMPSFSAYEITAYRIIFSLLTLLIFLLYRDGIKVFVKTTLKLFKSPTLYISSILIGINWFLFVYCTANNIILEASFGYFSGPLISIFLGLIFLKERVSSLKLIAIILTVISVAIQASYLDYFPWIAISLAFSFALYGLMKKFTKTESLNSLFFESLVLFVPAALYLLSITSNDSHISSTIKNSEYIFLALSGVVTILPLLFFTKAAKELPLNLLGFVQYLSPLLQFLAGYLVYDEYLSNIKVVSFIIIWFSCMLILVDQNRSRL